MNAVATRKTNRKNQATQVAETTVQRDKFGSIVGSKRYYMHLALSQAAGPLTAAELAERGSKLEGKEQHFGGVRGCLAKLMLDRKVRHVAGKYELIKESKKPSKKAAK